MSQQYADEVHTLVSVYRKLEEHAHRLERAGEMEARDVQRFPSLSARPQPERQSEGLGVGEELENAAWSVVVIGGFLKRSRRRQVRVVCACRTRSPTPHWAGLCAGASPAWRVLLAGCLCEACECSWRGGCLLRGECLLRVGVLTHFAREGRERGAI